jgi:hypothetical protein
MSGLYLHGQCLDYIYTNTCHLLHMYVHVFGRISFRVMLAVRHVAIGVWSTTMNTHIQEPILRLLNLQHYNASVVVDFCAFQSRRKCFSPQNARAVNFYNAGVVTHDCLNSRLDTY